MFELDILGCPLRRFGSQEQEDNRAIRKVDYGGYRKQELDKGLTSTCRAYSRTKNVAMHCTIGGLCFLWSFKSAKLRISVLLLVVIML